VKHPIVSLTRIDSRSGADPIKYDVTLPAGPGSRPGKDLGVVELDRAADQWIATSHDGVEVGRFARVLDAVEALS